MIIFLGDDGLYRDIIKASKNDKDIVVSCQYRHLVPKSLIQSHVCVNIHYGLLPKYAGCNPIYWQVKDGYGGVTLHYMDERFDTGDIIDQIELTCFDRTADEFYMLLRYLGRELLQRNYQSIIKDTAQRKKQDLALRQYKKSSDVDFNRVRHIENLDDAYAVSFLGKQSPLIKIRGREWKLIPND